MGKINLHSHTTYSDGANSLLQMAAAAQAHGHQCYVSTDHDYMMDPQKYLSQLQEAQQVEKELEFPVICGLEISIVPHEAALIGNKACLKWLEMREEGIKWDDPAYAGWLFDAITSVRCYSHALILVHPHKLDIPKWLESMLHGYEVVNSGSPMSPQVVNQLRLKCPQARGYIGMDSHGVRWFEDAFLDMCEYTEQKITTEAELIRWVTSGGSEWAQPELPSAEIHGHA